MVLYQHGEARAFDELYRRYAPRVYGYLRRLMGAGAETEDALQEVFFKLHAAHGRFDPALPFLPWLFAITRNVAIDHLRKARAIATDPQTLERMIAPDDGDPPGRETDWDGILEMLPPEQRGLIESRYREGRSFEEIAQAEGASAVTIRKRISRAVARIRAALARPDAKEDD